MVNRDETRRKNFRSGDVAAISIGFLLALTVLNFIVLTSPTAPGENQTVGLVIYGFFSILIYTMLIRGAMMKVRLDSNGVFIRNFWRSHTVGRSEYDHFDPPGAESARRSASAVLVTRGGAIKISSIQARNFNMIAGKPDPGSRRLVAEMNQFAHAFAIDSRDQPGR